MSNKPKNGKSVDALSKGNVFYAQKISELKTRQKYYRLVDFEKFQDVFTRVREEHLIDFKNRALDKMKTT